MYGKQLSLQKKKKKDGSNVLIKEQESVAAVHVVTSQGVGRFMNLCKVSGYSFCQQNKM